MLWCVRLGGDGETETGRAVFCAEIEGVSREDGGHLKDHPTRGDLKARVRFYEFGLCPTRVHAHTDTCAGTHTYRW